MAEKNRANDLDKKTAYVQFVGKDDDLTNVKNEVEIKVKPEPLECVTCTSRSLDTVDIYKTILNNSEVSLYDFLFKFTRVDLTNAQNSKHMCKTCFELVNVLQQAELEYTKLKQNFEEIISKNPLFDQSTRSNICVEIVKNETFEEPFDGLDISKEDSEDEPLAVTKKKRHRNIDTRKKKTALNKKKERIRNKSDNNKSDKDSWDCDVCGLHGDSGGVIANTAHKLATHTLDRNNTILQQVKREDENDESHSSQFNNSYNVADSVFKVEFEDDDDDDDGDDSPEFVLDIGVRNGNNQQYKRKRADLDKEGRTKTTKIRKKRDSKTLYNCEDCPAKYTSLARFERHKEKHSAAGKPPFICEVCGASYKHKRACDVHVALHKGISDWKCEECNKLFPSRGALHRHNNIHTGKTNYQCDQCGKSFIHTSSFKMHKLSHSGVKAYSCELCGLALMTRSHLKRHKRVHSGEKRHQCRVCGKHFAERYNLVAHSKSHDTQERPVLPRRRLFRCPFCVERFERKYMVERHATTVHGRTLERAPPTPRNTMSKLLKAQALARRDGDPPAPAPADAPASASAADDDTKSDRSSTKVSSSSSIKNTSQQTTAALVVSAGAWSNAYAAELGLRHDFH